MIFVPLNKHLLIEEIDLSEKQDSLVSLPEDYIKKSGDRYCTARFICHAEDCISLYEELFDSNIAQFDRAIFVNKYVSRFQLTMDYFTFMKIFNGAKQIVNYGLNVQS